MAENEKELPDTNMPDDLTLVKVLQSSVEFHVSKATNRLFLQFIDYHEGLVEISRADLLELVNILDKSQEEKEQGLLTELEEDEDDFL